MLDFFEAIRTNPTFKKFKVGQLLFAQYTCPFHEPSFGIWTHTDLLIHVLSGKKTWITPSGSWAAAKGDTLFFKKGAYVLRQSSRADFRILAFFIPDNFVRRIVRDLVRELPETPAQTDFGEMAIRVKNDAALSAFLNAVSAYFAGDDAPPDALLRLKLSELILGILFGRQNHTLSAYLSVVAGSSLPPVPAIMEANLCHNLSLEAYAKMCHRSLSSFKRVFHKCYGISPGRWLVARRLDCASRLLITTGMSVTEIVVECGFASPVHFSRAFKRRFQRSPTEYRQAAAKTATENRLAERRKRGTLHRMWSEGPTA